MTSSSREKLGLTLGFAGVLLFGGTLPATRLAVAAIDPLFLSAARAAIAGCLGLLLLLVLRRPIPPRALWHEVLFAGLCTIVGFPVFMALAMAKVPASHGGVVLGILPLATAAAAALLAHERPSLGFWLASTAGAIIVLVFMVRNSGANTVHLGDLYLLGTVTSGALGYTLSGRLSRKLPGWEVISWQVALFLPLSLGVNFMLWPTTLGDVPGSAWAGLACFFRIQCRYGNGRRRAGRPVDVAAALRDRRAVGPGERRTLRGVHVILCGGSCGYRARRPAHAGDAGLVSEALLLLNVHLLDGGHPSVDLRLEMDPQSLRSRPFWVDRLCPRLCQSVLDFWISQRALRGRR